VAGSCHGSHPAGAGGHCCVERVRVILRSAGGSGSGVRCRTRVTIVTLPNPGWTNDLDRGEDRGSVGPGSPWEGVHFCEDDWRVILQGDIEGGDASFKEQDARQIIDGLQFTFTLDGKPLKDTRWTAMRRFLNPPGHGRPYENAWYFQQGQFAPNILSVGSHRVDVTQTGPTGVIYTQGITFLSTQQHRGMRVDRPLSATVVVPCGCRYPSAAMPFLHFPPAPSAIASSDSHTSASPSSHTDRHGRPSS
jgi:hypothetical protein